MAIFKAVVGKQVRTPRGVLTFKSGELETTDKDVIAALNKAKGVVEVKTKQPDKQADKK